MDERPFGPTYEQARGRIVELVSDRDEDAASAAVPACPGWSVRDVIAHMAGICTDIIAGNVQSTPSDSWTAAQVAARKDRTIGETLTEWVDVGSQIASVVDDFPGQYGAQMVADVTVHEHDIRGALDGPGARDSESVAIGLEYLIGVLVRPSMSALGLGPLEVRTDGRSWVVGTGGPASGDPDAAWREALMAPEVAPSPTEAPVGSLQLDEFELFRALTGRRSAAQIKSYRWSVDPDPYLPMFGFGPFTIRSTALEE